jgi:hypothetical protein
MRHKVALQQRIDTLESLEQRGYHGLVSVWEPARRKI